MPALGRSEMPTLSPEPKPAPCRGMNRAGCATPSSHRPSCPSPAASSFYNSHIHPISCNPQPPQYCQLLYLPHSQGAASKKPSLCMLPSSPYLASPYLLLPHHVCLSHVTRVHDDLDGAGGQHWLQEWQSKGEKPTSQRRAFGMAVSGKRGCCTTPHNPLSLCHGPGSC